MIGATIMTLAASAMVVGASMAINGGRTTRQ